MSTYKFSVMESVREAYGFAWRERAYIGKLAALPILLQVMTEFAREMMIHKDASTIAYFLWGMPALAVYGWFMFVQARLILLGERIDRLPQDSAYRLDRQRCLRLCVIVVLLFNMYIIGVTTFMQWAVRGGGFDKQPLIAALVMLLIGMTFWALRFGVAHILVAVDYSVKKYIFAVNGVFFSFQILALGLLCAMPVLFVFGLLADLLGVDPLNPSKRDIIVMIVLGAPVSALNYSLMNAAGAFMLKRVLGKGAS